VCTPGTLGTAWVQSGSLGLLGRAEPTSLYFLPEQLQVLWPWASCCSCRPVRASGVVLPCLWEPRAQRSVELNVCTSFPPVPKKFNVSKLGCIFEDSMMAVGMRGRSRSYACFWKLVSEAQALSMAPYSVPQCGKVAQWFWGLRCILETSLMCSGRVQLIGGVSVFHASLLGQYCSVAHATAHHQP
jgi:hypothetical protein